MTKKQKRGQQEKRKGGGMGKDMIRILTPDFVPELHTLDGQVPTYILVF